jgi:cyclophilin family peptidyl-prolyl cis-trans isomerase
MRTSGLIVSALMITAVILSGCSESHKVFPVVVLETSMGEIELELFEDVAPRTTENFMTLVSEGFYDSLKFHRVIPRFMIQAGDPRTAGRSRADFSIPGEANDSSHHFGSLAMARSGNNLNSASTQFYICVGRKNDLEYLDSLQFTVFGRIKAGGDIAVAISNTPTSGSVQRIMQDSVWRAELVRLAEIDSADVELVRPDMPTPDRPLDPVWIKRAYIKQ